ncbi:hypothetical protein Q8F55_002858 [Vanrija albida]|uniref:DUF676 domain-containing protein n=1 Tax=Vanrija albida TaxID=181172 RepID=A0ABR3QB06_9TREE
MGSSATDDKATSDKATANGPPAPAPAPATKATANGPPASPKFPIASWDVQYIIQQSNGPFLFQQSPWKLLCRDLRYTASTFWQLPDIFLPLSDTGGDIRLTGIIAQVLMLVISLVLAVLIVLGALGVAPLLLVLAVLATVVFVRVASALQGASTRQSKADVPSAVNADKEKWLFVNGICTTGSGAQSNVDRLQTLFHRPVTAVLNRSLGMLFDLGECILQRDYRLITQDIRVGYFALRDAVLDPKLERVVLIGHSQGGIIVTAMIDQLLAEFPHHVLKKVEIYTFASAANHICDPSGGTPDSPPPFGHIEHFANQGDWVSQFGVLGHAPLPPGDTPNIIAEEEKDGEVATFPMTDGEFAGRIFERLNHTGHLLNSHYNSILDNPVVRKYSRLATYLDGGNPVP